MARRRRQGGHVKEEGSRGLVWESQAFLFVGDLDGKGRARFKQGRPAISNPCRCHFPSPISEFQLRHSLCSPRQILQRHRHFLGFTRRQRERSGIRRDGVGGERAASWTSIFVDVLASTCTCLRPHHSDSPRHFAHLAVLEHSSLLHIHRRGQMRGGQRITVARAREFRAATNVIAWNLMPLTHPPVRLAAELKFAGPQDPQLLHGAARTTRIPRADSRLCRDCSAKHLMRNAASGRRCRWKANFRLVAA